MYDINSLDRLVHDARQHARQTQREFADRVGTSQSAIAKLEMGDANPTVDTLARCAEAAGLALQLTLVPRPVTDAVVERYKRDVDRTLLRENLRRSVHERLRSLGEWQGDLAAMRYAVSQARPQNVAAAPSTFPARDPGGA